MSAVVRLADGGQLVFRCPGCNDWHSIRVGEGEGSRWQWNGDSARPTISPSILLRTGHYVSGHRQGADKCWCDYKREHPEDPSPFSCVVCHSFIRGGEIQFLGDCTHGLAGKTVALPPVGNP